MPTRELLAMAAVLALWLVAVAMVGAGGEFPLSDDWSYAHVVRSLVEGRGLDLLPWTGASLLLQAFYGAAVCKLAGFSHETLRLTTLAMSAAGIATFHLLLLELGATTRLAVAGALALALSPLWFNLSFTFMTDVPFATLSLAALWLYLRALSGGSARAALLAGAVCAAAFLIRQPALAIAGAAALAALLPPRTAGARVLPLSAPLPADAAARLPADAPAPPPADAAGARPSPAPRSAARFWPAPQQLRFAAAALALPLATAAAYTAWAVATGNVPLGLQNKLGEAAGVQALPLANVAFRATMTLGLLMLPWAVLRIDGPRGARAWLAASLVALALAAVFVFAREGALMFYLSNLMDDFSVGALTTRDTLFLGWPLRPKADDKLRMLLTLASALSAAALLARIAAPLAASSLASERGRRAALLCASALALSALATLLQVHYYFDRYLLLLVPLAIASLVAVAPQARPGPLFALLLAGLSLYSVAGTHDYMEWNRARWSLLTGLESRGVSARSIDGGVEYNAERLAASLRSAPSDAEARRGQADTIKSWWWVDDDEWVVSFRRLPGYVQSDAREWSRWLPPVHASVLLLRRQPPGAEQDGDGSRDRGRFSSPGSVPDRNVPGGAE